ncbi:MAG: hypothetical protein O3C45_05215 [Bacteroidetes bacterium]|nr:hypothetical protein [Bacteroidota bacterium]
MLEALTDFTIPVLHPIVVHFPVALGLSALLSAGVWLVRNQDAWWKSTLLLIGLAFLGGVLALRTGEAMEEQSEGVAMVDRFVHLHEELAEWSVWILGAAFLAMLVALWMGRRDVSSAGTPLRWRAVVFLAVLTAAILLGLTGHVGGIMTWGVPV